MSKALIVIGILQFMTSYGLIGYMWAIYWGYMVVRKSMSTDNSAGIDIAANQALKRGSMTNQDGGALQNVNRGMMNPYEVQ